MTKIYKISILVAAMIIFAACNTEMEHDVSVMQKAAELPAESVEDIVEADFDLKNGYGLSKYDFDFYHVAFAVNKLMVHYPEFREMLHSMVKQKFDGDYNVLISQLINKFPEVEQMFYSKKLRIGEILEKYPLIQIAIPMNFDMWNTEEAMPTVYLPEEYQEGETPVLFGYNEKGMEWEIPEQDIPDFPVAVISENERVQHAPCDNPPPYPLEFTGSITDFGIELRWVMPQETNADNTSGYQIYREDNYGGFNLIYTSTSYLNRSYLDNGDLMFNSKYNYYIVAYNNCRTTSEKFCQGAPFTLNTRPSGATKLEVDPVGPNQVRFRWNFDNTSNNGTLNFYRRDYYSEPAFPQNPFHSVKLPVNGDETLYAMPAGAQWEYRIDRTTPTGTSEPRYDLVYMPYRDVTQKSSVYIKGVSHSDVSKIESWRGAPEYLIKAWRVKNDGTNLTVVEEFSKEIHCSSKKDNKWQSTSVQVMSDWQPGFDGATWYDRLSFYVVEYDGEGDKINVGDIAQSAQKIYNAFDDYSDKPASMRPAQKIAEWIGVVAIVVAEVATQIPKWVNKNDEKIGYIYLDYWENPEKRTTINDEAGENFTIEFSENP